MPLSHGGFKDLCIFQQQYPICPVMQTHTPKFDTKGGKKIIRMGFKTIPLVKLTTEGFDLPSLASVHLQFSCSQLSDG